jgi:hypothetical protein
MSAGKIVGGLALIPFSWFFLICWKVLGALGFEKLASKCWIIGLRITTKATKLLGDAA